MADEIARLDVVVDVDDKPLLAGGQKIAAAFKKIGLVGQQAGSQFQNAFTNGARQAGRSISNMSIQAQKDLNGISSSFANIKNIAQGIIFAQTFYAGLRAMQGLVGEAAKLSVNLESAQASFSVLLGDAERATQTVEFLQDYAARTAFDFDSASKAAKTLVAYGFEYKNLAYLMETIGDAAAAVGDPQAFDRIARALGQMLAKGTVKAEEIRQLTEAGVPAAKILAEQMGLTAKEVANIGKLGIDSSKAVNALLTGMQQKFAGLNNIMTMTVRGLQNNIRETAAMIGQQLGADMYESFRQMLIKVSTLLEGWLKSLRAGGPGGLLDAILSPKDAQMVRVLAAQLILLKATFGELLRAIAPVAISLAQIGISIGNVILPVIAVLVQMVTSAIEIFSRWQGSIYLVASALTALIVVKSVVKTLAVLSAAGTALGAAWASGLLPVILGVTAALFALFSLLGRGGGLAKNLTNIGDSISKTFGLGSEKVLQPTIKKTSKGIEGMNDKIISTGEAIDGITDKTKKAGKAAKATLAAFDEVYTIPEQLDATGGKLDEVPFPEIDMGAFTPPDFSNIAKQITDKFKFQLSEKFKNAGFGALIAGILGAAIGGIIGGPLGAKLGGILAGLAGFLAGYFWDELSKSMQNAFTGAGIGALIGALLGSLFGHPAIGAAIGALLGWIAGMFWEDWKESFEKHPLATVAITGLGTLIGALLGGMIGGPAGAIIGAGIGTLVGGIIATFWDDFLVAFEEHPARTTAITAIGTLLGGFFGFMLGGPVGAVIGAGIGALASGLVAAFWDQLSAFFSKTKDAAQKALGEAIASAAKQIGMGLADLITTFTLWKMNSTKIWEEWKTDTAKIFGDWWTDTKSGFSKWWEDTSAGFETWWTDTKAMFADWKNLTWADISTWWTDTTAGYDKWCEDNRKSLGDWVGSIKDLFVDWAEVTKGSIGDWITDTIKSYDDWCTRNRERFFGWTKDVKEAFLGLWDDVKEIWNNLFGKENTAKLRVDAVSGAAPGKLSGHATGGVFDREHIARFAEGNKAEAIIPLENPSAMAPFVNAVSDRVLNAMAPLMTQTTQPAQEPLRPVYVGTLIADDRGLRELNRKIKLIEEGEQKRTFQS